MFLCTAFPTHLRPHPPALRLLIWLDGPARGPAHPGEGGHGCLYFSVVSACLNPTDCTLLRNPELRKVLRPHQAAPEIHTKTRLTQLSPRPRLPPDTPPRSVEKGSFPVLLAPHTSQLEAHPGDAAVCT